MQDLAGTALQRAHLAAHLSRSTLASRRIHHTTANKWRVFVHLRPSGTAFNAAVLHWMAVFRAFPGRWLKMCGGFSCISRRVAVFETSFDRKRTRDARFTATRSEMFDLPPHIETRIMTARRPLIPPPHVDRYLRPLRYHTHLLTETNICLLLCYDDWLA